MSDVTIKRALLSVSDKSGLAELGQALAGRGVELVSTGGTARTLREAELDVRDVSDLTGFPEMMDGRVKTLHPKVHGGLLALRDNEDHVAAMEEHAIGAIDLVVVNLYPFEATVAKGAERAEIIENIDIGGPSMVRSAAKNHGFVTILTDPADYATLIEELEAHDGATSQAFRIRMAGKAYARTAAYDAAIANWFAYGDAFTHPLGVEALHATPFTETMPLAFKREDTLRYGENPHQSAAVYTPQVTGGA
ncbi:MAG: bifunctional phosphoribosylaminoimidazolecarboxamide formyltransferase/IMP cyclohydrolase, partial [Pseudomonadota bacterium]